MNVKGEVIGGNMFYWKEMGILVVWKQQVEMFSDPLLPFY